MIQSLAKIGTHVSQSWKCANYQFEYAGSAECGSSFMFSVIYQNKYWLLASINTEKLCPSVVQCYPQAFGPRATLHNFGA